MSERWPLVKLGDVADLCLGKMLDANKNKGRLLPYLRNPNVRWFDVDTTDLRMMPFEEHEDERYGLRAGDIVICEGGEAGRAAIWDGRIPDLKFQKAIHRVRPADELDARYLVHRLMVDYQSGYLAEYYTGATIKHLTGQDLARYRFPLPPIAEQRRIAEILDKADALRAKRRAALARLDTLTQSIFLDLFGDPVTNPNKWDVKPLVRLLAAPLRNGLSPSKGGRMSAKVLTLSAVTGSAFDPESFKTSTFHITPPAEQSVHDEDLLICRGNGNLKLVGKGYFPSQRMPDVTFPDTMIAARIDRQLTDPAFLQHVWNSALVRRQIESAARTTNGTLKVNQSMLESVLVLSPPVPKQREFGVRAIEVAKVKSKQLHALSAADALFASLQHRAFRGEL